MKKRYLLLFCLSFLCSHKIWADVGSIQIRLNENMQVVDLSTSAVSTSTIDEVFVQQGGLTTAADTDKFDGNGKLNDPNDACPKEFGKKCDETETICFCCQNGDVCLEVDGDECTEKDMLRPFCGCPSEDYPRKEDGTSINEEDNLPFCCDMDGAYISVKKNDGIRDKDHIEDKNEDFTCSACPTDSIILNDNYCCNAAGKIYQGNRWSDAISARCYCAMENKTNCKSKDTCENTPGMEWCEKSGVCVSDGEPCPCVPGDDDNACSDEDSCEDKGGCWIDEICEEKDSDKNCDQQACEAGGQKWCGETEGCKDECPCTPGNDENACPDDDSCTAHGGCWDGTTCKAVQSCPDGQSWDETICACSEPVSCSEGELIDGVCFPCPEGGEIKGNGGEEVCCNGNKQWYTEGAWSESPNYAKCGCPEDQYLEGNQCFPCTLDTHCSAEGKVCDNIGSHTCVECTNAKDAKCTGGRVCNDDTNTCTCPEGEYWNGSSCVECDGNYGTAATWPCSSSDKPLCNSSGVCEDCPTSEPNWYNGQCVECTENDPCSDGVCQTETKTCVQCLTNGDCSNNTNNKHCVNNQCVQCTDDEHCEKGLCVDNKCKACKTGADCQDGEWCDVENGLCVAGCNTTMVQDETNNTCYCDKGADSKTPIWDAWRNRCVSCFRANDKKPVWNVDTQKCEECGWVEPRVPGKDRRKVWDLYNEKCVPCYDSISANWTDLGCGNAQYHSTYDPREGNTFLTRVCKVEKNIDTNSCVQCTAHSHCPGATPKCNDQNTCVECNGHYGTNATWPCPTEEKPKCNSSGVCEACPTNAPNWDTNRQRCWACTKHYTEPGDGEHCPKDKPYCDRDKDKDHKCETCVERDARIPDEEGRPKEIIGKVKTLFGAPTDDSNFRGCFLCKNDKDGAATDTGCTDNYPICSTAKDALYNACCPINQPKWDNKNKKCVCNAGYTYSETQSKCIPCAVGTYKTKAGNEACTGCPDNKTTTGEASTSSKQCVECTENRSCGTGKHCHNNDCVDCTTDSLWQR